MPTMVAQDRSAPEAVRVWLLGDFSVSVGERKVDETAWRLRKAASLMKLLTLAPGHRMHREQAMDLLLPDSGKKAASNNLSQILHVARRALTSDPAEGSRYLTSQDESLVLCPGGELWVDVDAFEEAAATARRARDAGAYRAALELYSGELLPGDRYEEWAEGRRQELRRTWLSLHLELARVYEERREYEEGIEALQRVLSEEPTNEEVHATLMRLYAFSERRGDALAQYERLREVLSGELDEEVSATTERLREEIAAGRFPPVQPIVAQTEEPSERGKHNLAASRTSFVGREQEMVEIKRHLAMTRLLTLTGVGGSGKTRLALEVARDLIGAYPDGVWVVELAPLSEGALVPQAVARSLGVTEQAEEPLTVTLAEILRTKQTLLVLDNCEHLVEAVARLVDVVLDACPLLQVLATSREGLGIAGEMRQLVSSLSVPDPRQLPTAAELERYESVRLFVQRARSRNPAFALTPQNMQSVVQICERLDGKPLAIELAAARIGLSAEQIAARLDDSLQLLTAGSRTATSRQRTLRGALAWSYDLLSEPEQVLFGRLSVFAGGWTLQAAKAVGSGEGIAESEVLDLHSGLVDKSLVVAQATGKGGVRYRMLEPVRQYALEKSEEGGETEELRHRHAGFFLALAEEAEPKLRGPEDMEWLERLEAEHGNLRAALSWVLERGEAALALRLGGALGMFWRTRGHYGEGKKWLQAALAKDDRASAALRVKALQAVFWLTYYQMDLNGAEAVAQEAIDLSAEAEIDSSLAPSLRIMLAGPARVRGDYERAKELLEKSLALSREVDDKVMISDALSQLAVTTHKLGDTARAKEILGEGIALCREVGYTYRLCEFLVSRGYVSLLDGEYKRAVALSEEAAALSREYGYKRGLQFAQVGLGWAALLQGNYERARTLYEESLTLCQELNDKLTSSENLDGLACVAGAQGEVARAGRLFGAAEALREAVHKAVAFQHQLEVDTWREPYLASARSRLGEAAWEEVLAQGRIMGLEQAIEYALSEEESQTPEQTSAGAQPPNLTPREQEVALLVGRGLTNRQIAQELSISERTVENHIGKILKKLGFSSRARIATWVAQR